jgi:hypothetical protein
VIALLIELQLDPNSRLIAIFRRQGFTDGPPLKKIKGFLVGINRYLYLKWPIVQSPFPGSL